MVFRNFQTHQIGKLNHIKVMHSIQKLNLIKRLVRLILMTYPFRLLRYSYKFAIGKLLSLMYLLFKYSLKK